MSLMNFETEARWNKKALVLLLTIFALAVYALYFFVNSRIGNSGVTVPPHWSPLTAQVIRPKQHIAMPPPKPLASPTEIEPPIARQALQIVKKTRACLTIGNDTTILCFVRETRSLPKNSKSH